MKKRIFSLFMIITVVFAALLSFVSCDGDGASSSGFTVSETSYPDLDYNKNNNTTAVTIAVRVTNQTRTTIDSLSFFAEFRDSNGSILDSRVCTMDFPLESGESRGVSYEFSGSGISENSVIKGRVSSVTYSPCSIKVAGSASSVFVESGAEPLSGFGVFMLVLSIIFCIGMIVIGIVMIVIGADDMEDWMVACGIILIAAAVVIGITFIILA